MKIKVKVGENWEYSGVNCVLAFLWKVKLKQRLKIEVKIESIKNESKSRWELRIFRCKLCVGLFSIPLLHLNTPRNPTNSPSTRFHAISLFLSFLFDNFFKCNIWNKICFVFYSWRCTMSPIGLPPCFPQFSLFLCWADVNIRSCFTSVQHFSSFDNFKLKEIILF